MKFGGNNTFIFLGAVNKVSKKTDKSYSVISIMQEAETMACMVDDDVKINDLKFGDEISVSIDYNLMYKGIKITDIQTF